MIALLALMTALAQSCEAPKAVGETTQVAWISTVQDRVGAKSELTVFRTADLRTFVQERGRDATKLLQALGMLRPKQEAKKTYKITLFDVKVNGYVGPSMMPVVVRAGWQHAQRRPLKKAMVSIENHGPIAVIF